MIEGMETLRQSIDDHHARLQRLKQSFEDHRAQIRDLKEALDYNRRCRLRAFIKQTTKDLVAYIESHHELRAEACCSGQHRHVAENIFPVHLEKLGIHHRYWTLIEQAKEAKESPYVWVGNKLRHRYKVEKRERPYDESPEQFAYLLRSDRFRETDVYGYWAPLFPTLYKKTVEELEKVSIMFL